jgi:hypothetical protein
MRYGSDEDGDSARRTLGLENGSNGELQGLPLEEDDLTSRHFEGVPPAVAKRTMVFDSISNITLFEAR